MLGLCISRKCCKSGTLLFSDLLLKQRHVKFFISISMLEFFEGLLNLSYLVLRGLGSRNSLICRSTT
ncbi:unnamed protein product [Meloidogyne enterolobii]|uniref:Uncharacterized protein n=1 Tax=Meloidogyne enterolobii TaxID=390850 RepID=A0ACB0XVR4_MELEN